jgi:restriction system protein
MSIPDYQSLMLPLLTLAADGNEHRFRNAVEQLAARFELSDDERATMLPSGTAPMFDNRVGWAKTYLKQAGLIDATRRGYFRITPRGTELLGTHPVQIDSPCSRSITSSGHSGHAEVRATACCKLTSR